MAMDAHRPARVSMPPVEVVEAPAGTEPARHSRDGPSRRTGVRRFVRERLILIPLLVLALWTVSPLLLTISVSFKQPVEVYASPGLLPDNPSFEAYLRVVSRPEFRLALLNSVIVGVGSCALTLALAVPAAYAFARYRFRGRHLLLLFVLLPKLIPPLGLMVPLYRLAVALGALDSRLTLITVYTGVLLPLAVWLLVGFFQNIPREIEEAASVDGATLWQRLRLIVLPLSLPALLTIGVVALREAWDEFTLVLVLTTQPETRTLPYELFVISEPSVGQGDFPGQAAFALITVLPLLLLYRRLEQYVVEGITAGSVK
jgi:ABC-type glycerol-3-phosphate transport system permease component